MQSLGTVDNSWASDEGPEALGNGVLTSGCSDGYTELGGV